MKAITKDSSLLSCATTELLGDFDLAFAAFGSSPEAIRAFVHTFERDGSSSQHYLTRFRENYLHNKNQKYQAFVLAMLWGTSRFNHFDCHL